MLKAGVAAAISEDKTLSFAAVTDSAFHNLSVVCNAVWEHLPTEPLSKLASMLSNPAAALSMKLCHVLSLLLLFLQSSQHLLQEWIPSQEITFSAHPLKLHDEIAAIQWHLQAPLLILVPFHFHHICSDFMHWSLELLTAFLWVELSFFQTPVNVDILTSSHESQVFWVASRMMNPFRRFLPCPHPSEESLSMAALALQNYFLNNKTGKSKSLLDLRAEECMLS